MSLNPLKLTFGVAGSSTSSCVVFPFLLLFPKGGWSVSLAAALLEAADESRSMMSSQHPGIISLVKRPVVVLKSEMKHPIKFLFNFVEDCEIYKEPFQNIQTKLILTSSIIDTFFEITNFSKQRTNFRKLTIFDEKKAPYFFADKTRKNYSVIDSRKTV